MSRNRPEIGEQAQLLAQRQQACLGSGLGGRVIPPGTADGTQDHRVRAPACREGGFGERIPEFFDGVAADRTLIKLEVVIELLSTEAVEVRPGMKVILDGWGGSQSLNATVQRVEPHAFTKVSALGIEEKRTNVIADFVDAPKALGDGYRVNAHIVVWAADNVTKVPASALFRCGEAWCAFAVENGRAKKRTLKIGHSNAQEAEVLEGLKPGETVIRHPANQIEEGARVATG